MAPDAIRRLLEGVAARRVSVERALSRMKHLPFEDRGFAKLDHHRALRKGLPEAIYAEGKTPARLVEIFLRAADRDTAIATRVSPAQAAFVRRRARGAVWHPDARILASARPPSPDRTRGSICIVTAGTSDLPVADEAAVTCAYLGDRVVRVSDVGVAGLHRLMAHRVEIVRASVVVVVAGMEGALPSVVAGFAPSPVVAVPTSVGYGASYGGLAALLAMLNSCADGVGVVNIDNGYGAACLASLINRRRSA